MLSRFTQQAARRAVQQQSRAFGAKVQPGQSNTGSCLKSEEPVGYASPFVKSDIYWMVGIPAVVAVNSVWEQYRFSSNLQKNAEVAKKYGFTEYYKKNRVVLQEKFGFDVEKYFPRTTTY
eukprot:UN00411